MLKLDLSAAHQQAIDGATQLHAHDREFREAHATSLTRERQLLSLLAPHDEAVATMHTCVDEAGQGRSARYAREVLMTFGGYLSTGNEQVTRVPGQMFRLGDHDRVALEDLCWLVPDLVKASLEQTIRSNPPELSGSSMEGRQRLLDEQRAHTSAIEAQHTELVDLAAGIGITLELLPVVKARRAREADQLKRNAEDNAERARIEQLVNTQSQPSRAVGRSEYLRQNTPGFRN